MKLHPNVGSYLSKGIQYLPNFGRYNHALEIYKRALNLQPHNMNAIINKGSVLHVLERYSEAISCYNMALNINQNNPIVIAYKGLCIAETGNFRLAIKYFKKALSIDSECELAEISINTAKCIMKSQ